jgi:hypothetical protein
MKSGRSLWRRVYQGKFRRLKKEAPSSQPLRFVSRRAMRFLSQEQRAERAVDAEACRKTDIWLHAQKTHGSHVIAFCDENDHETLIEARSSPPIILRRGTARIAGGLHESKAC